MQTIVKKKKSFKLNDFYANCEENLTSTFMIWFLTKMSNLLFTNCFVERLGILVA